MRENCNSHGLKILNKSSSGEIAFDLNFYKFLITVILIITCPLSGSAPLRDCDL